MISDQTKRIIRLPKVRNKTGLSRSTIYAFMKDGKFPSSISLSERTVGWLESSIDDWIDSKIQNQSGRGCK